MRKGDAITLKDVAKKLNVSTVTISKALRNHPDISSKTKNLILKTVQEMGYTPNFMARNLSSKKTNTIGLIVPKIAHFFFGVIIESIYNVAFDSGYEIILMISQENEAKERKHIQTLLSMKVDGILISISEETKDYSIFDTVNKNGVPIVFIDRVPNLSNINQVNVDDEGGAFNAIEHAIKIGYRKIGHFAGYEELNIGKLRLKGYKRALKKYNIPYNKDWVVKGGFDEEFGYKSFMKLYEENNLPELIFTVTYPVALGIYKATNELNMKIPEDIDVICFGAASEQQYLSPPLSSVNQPTDLIAKNAMKILLSKISDNNSDEKFCVELPTELIIRGTCKSKN